jgi:predicted nucleotidyltransferase
MCRLFTPDERQAVLEQMLAALQTDDRIAGVIVVGSGAVGFEDEYSDIDLAVVVHQARDVRSVYDHWRAQFKTLLPVRHEFEAPRGPNILLFGLLLDHFLEIDASFQCLDDLTARRARWRVAFDRSGQITPIMQASWDARETPDIQATYLRWVKSIWYYITHVAIHVERGHLWRAVLDLEDLRHRAVVLAGLRHSVETEHYREVHRLPPDFLAGLEHTLVTHLDEIEIMRALRAAVDCFFTEAKALDLLLGLDLAPALETDMYAYIDVIHSA